MPIMSLSLLSDVLLLLRTGLEIFCRNSSIRQNTSTLRLMCFLETVLCEIHAFNAAMSKICHQTATGHFWMPNGCFYAEWLFFYQPCFYCKTKQPYISLLTHQWTKNCAFLKVDTFSTCIVNSRAAHDVVGYNQDYHTVLISKICPYFAVLRLRKY